MACCFLPAPRRLEVAGGVGARRPRWHVLRTPCEGAGGSPSEWRTGPGAKAAYPTAAQNAPMSQIESIGMTRSQGRPASLNEARRVLVNPDLRSVVLGSQADRLDLQNRSRWRPTPRLSRCGGGGFAGGAAVRRRPRHAGRRPRSGRRHHDRARRSAAVRKTPVFMPGFEGGSCPLFIIKRHAKGSSWTC